MRASTVTIEGRDGARPRVEVRRARRPRPRSAGVPARHEASREHASGTARSPTPSTAATSHYRLCQEVVLGMGGAATAPARSATTATRIYHLNEGHSALLTLQLLERQLDGRAHVRARRGGPRARAAPRASSRRTRRCRPATTSSRSRWCGTCSATSASRCSRLRRRARGRMLNMTHLALRLSRFVNGVAMRHREVSRGCSRTIRSTRSPTACTRRRGRRRRSRRCSTGAFPSGGATTCICATRSAFRSQEIRDAHAESEGTCCSTEIARRTGVQLDPNGVHDRLRAPRDAVQARRPHLLRPRAAGADRAHASGRSRSSSAARRIRTTAAARSSFAASTRRGEQLGDVVQVVYVENYEMAIAAQDGRRRRSLAEQSDEAARGVAARAG